IASPIGPNINLSADPTPRIASPTKLAEPFTPVNVAPSLANIPVVPLADNPIPATSPAAFLLAPPVFIIYLGRAFKALPNKPNDNDDICAVLPNTFIANPPLAADEANTLSASEP